MRERKRKGKDSSSSNSKENTKKKERKKNLQSDEVGLYAFFLLPRFRVFKKELVQQYDSHIIETIFRSLIKAVYLTDSKELPIDYILDRIKEDLKRKKMSVLNLEYLVTNMMDVICDFDKNIKKDSMFNHHDKCSKIVWKVLAQYVNNPGDYIENLTSDILKEFESSGSSGSSISVRNISTKLYDKKMYHKLPFDAIYQCVYSVYDYFEKKGHIKSW